jgi:integral membrane sensor domain MASE1
MIFAVKAFEMSDFSPSNQNVQSTSQIDDPNQNLPSTSQIDDPSTPLRIIKRMAIKAAIAGVVTGASIGASVTMLIGKSLENSAEKNAGLGAIAGAVGSAVLGTFSVFFVGIFLKEDTRTIIVNTAFTEILGGILAGTTMGFFGGETDAD